MEDNLKRLNKFIGETGYCSRREADKFIEEGRVTLNGIIPELGTKVSPGDEVRIDGKLIHDNNQKLIYLAFNKPAGIECTTNLEVRDNIVDYINYPTRIFPIGRLDKASEGLIFMTNDGDIVNKILRARNNHEKEYTVTVNRPITDRFIERMGNGVPILDTVTRKCNVEQISKYVFKIVLTQGLNRQIRRMCEYLGYEVTALKRIRIINISLDLPVGRWRDLTDSEIKELNTLIEPSSKTQEASLPKSDERKREAVKKPDGIKRSAVIGKAEVFRKPLIAREPERTEKAETFKKPSITRKSEPMDKDEDVKKPLIIRKSESSPKREVEKEPESNPDGSKRRTEFISKDDPRYRKPGDY
jgi:23S rRNA pseudouridine2604 synthase